MTVFLARRLPRSLLTLAFIVTLVFVGTRLTGDPTMWLLPDDAPPQARASMRAALAVDKPIPEQYWRYLQGLARGDFGNSFYERRPVTQVFAERLGPTLRLSGLALVLSILIGVPVGIMTALHRNSVLDRTLMSLSFTAYAIPNFVLGIMLILIFSLVLRWLPSGGYGDWRHYLMPVFTLGASHAALIARLTRSSMLEVLNEDYVRTARAKGLPGRVTVWKHALRNAFLPVLTIVGLSLATLISGSVVTETVFAWPGVGRLVLTSVVHRDFPTLQFVVLVIACAVVVANVLVDISYSLLDPRIRIGS